MNNRLPNPARLPALRPGDTVSLVAPASPPQPAAFTNAVAALERLGYPSKCYRDVCASAGYLAGDDASRIAELHAAFDDPDTKLVLAVRGGYGVGRLLDRIEFKRLVRRPKFVVGYSDITALHAAIQRQTGLVSLHGPNLVGGLGDDSAASLPERDQWLALVSGKLATGADLCPSSAAANLRTVTPGVAQGRLIGGNLAVLNALIGTPFQPDFEAAILLLEDTGETPYRIDRLLTQLRTAGLLAQLAGVLVGAFSDTGAETSAGAVEALLDEFLTPLGVPVLAGLPIGHEHPNLPLPLGGLVEIDASNRRFLLAQDLIEDQAA
ncbi:S66 peptidase family protein [Botrimarina hoheduenensis]|uniref:Putative murein peptide carboxypeptidase n=1 Tax=Botrimarina hoheduenensis TaxID=2528000 RepID=A0A5C5WDQ1_9BACT|nr:LD-carboxypeptidase [Botrimarina hoheduenensis]TWT48824.1 putative murein peptide carboxypeptidase [Botrimarina hoheduenensis]